MDNIFSWIEFSFLLWQLGMAWEAPGGFCCHSPEHLDVLIELSGWKIHIQEDLYSQLRFIPKLRLPLYSSNIYGQLSHLILNLFLFFWLFKINQSSRQETNQEPRTWRAGVELERNSNISSGDKYLPSQPKALKKKKKQNNFCCPN